MWHNGKKRSETFKGIVFRFAGKGFGYHSLYKTTDLEIFDLVREMGRELPWLAPCLNHFEATNIGANHDLMQLFEEPVPELDII